MTNGRGIERRSIDIKVRDLEMLNGVQKVSGVKRGSINGWKKVIYEKSIGNSDISLKALVGFLGGSVSRVFKRPVYKEGVAIMAIPAVQG